MVEISAELLGGEVGNWDLVLQVPNFDGVLSGGAQPVSVGAEGKAMDDVSSFQGIQVFAFSEVPQHGSSIFSTGSAKRTVRGNSDGVDVSSVAIKVGLQLSLGEIPNLDGLVPATGNDQRSGGVRGKFNRANPFSVSVRVLSSPNGELAFSEGIPQLDGFVSRSGNNLTIVSRESNAENILGVSGENAGSFSVVQIPQSKGSIPRTRESKLGV